MKIVPITKNALAMEVEDWDRLGTLMNDFNRACDSQSCSTCPLQKFCHENPSPADYLKHLYEFLDD